jgi:CheY-like chemotaxis protein
MADALQPDLVLLDLSMPVADGQSALASLLRVAPHARVVVLSGTDPKNADELVAAGATAFLPKGIPPFELLDRLGSIVGRPITVQRTPPASPRGPETSKPIPQSEVHAILCDDDAVSRKLVAHVLAGCDVSVTAETDAVPSLLSVIGLTKPDLVVLDLWLEGTTGLTAISEIRTLSPRTHVVVYSAYEEWREKAVLAGVAAFVAKPHFDELEREIRRLTRAAPR